MKSFAVILAVASVTAFADEAVRSAKGSGLIQFGPNREEISFKAETRNGGTVAEGRADVRDISAGVEVRLDVNCLNVLGNTATVSGIVTRSSDETRVPVGFEGIFQVVDNGDKAPDFMSLANFFEVGVGTDCNAPGEFDLVPLQKGNIRVR
jgi:hypothetical protein